MKVTPSTDAASLHPVAGQAVFELQRSEQRDNQDQNNQPKAVDEISQFQNAKYVGSSEAAGESSNTPLTNTSHLWLA